MSLIEVIFLVMLVIYHVGVTRALYRDYMSKEPRDYSLLTKFGKVMLTILCYFLAILFVIVSPVALASMVTNKILNGKY